MKRTACVCDIQRLEAHLHGERVLLRSRPSNPALCTWGYCAAIATKLHLCRFFHSITLADRYCDECSEMDSDCARSATHYKLEISALEGHA